MISVDTVKYSSWVGPTGQFTNSPQALPKPKDYVAYNLLYFSVPIGICFNVSDRIDLRMGINLLAPIFTQRTQENLYVQSDGQGANANFTWIFNRVNDRTGSDINKLAFSCFAEMKYRVAQHISIHFRTGQALTSLYQNEVKSQYNTSSNPRFAPTQAHLGLGWQF